MILYLLLALPLAQEEGTQHPFELAEHRRPELQTGGTCLITNATIHSALAPATVGDVLVVDGDIAKVGGVGEVQAPDGTVVIDGTGKHLAPGVIDCHSHMAIERGINEGSLSITADVDISDSVNADDLTIWRALAGGVTCARLLHGSANTIGGRHEVIKLKWERTADELRFPGAPEGIKFALGENVKRSNGGGSQTRYPATRMGVETVFYRAFTRAREYQAEWSAYVAALQAGEDPAPPRRDIRLDVLVGILDGEVKVHSHCYRADEILMLLRTAESYGFRVQTLQHVLEGYKIADEIAEHGAGPSTFSDWWAYKIEAYDAIPFNGALMDRAGAVVSFNSDSGELVRRMYGEAAKGVRYGDMDRVAALRLVTLNPAIQLGIDSRTGSIEAGKDADLALLDGDPLSSLSRVLWTMVDGEIEFQRRDAFDLDMAPGPVTAISEPADADVAAARWDPDGGDTVAIIGATIHPVTSPAIEGGTLLMQGGRIVGMGAGLEVPSDARIFPADGKHLWPGLIALGTNLGLFEIGSVRATRDQSEIGGNQPDVRVTAALNADSAHIGVARYGGVTRAQSIPGGGGPLRGQSAVIRTTGDTWEELLTLDRDTLHLSFPRTSNDAKEKKFDSDEIEALRELLADSREYARLVAQHAESGAPLPPFDPRLEALAPFARGEQRVAVHASGAQTILFAIRFIQEEELDAALYGCGEGWKVAEAVAASGIPVVLGSVLTTPRSGFDPYDAAFANAAVLHRAGARVAIGGDGGNARNLSHHAAMAAAFGLPHEEAVRAVTFYAARAVGLEAELGSLAPGKLADVLITDGDLLEITTHVEAVFIDGRQASLENRQTRLYEEYSRRLDRLMAE